MQLVVVRLMQLNTQKKNAIVVMIVSAMELVRNTANVTTATATVKKY